MTKAIGQNATLAAAAINAVALALGAYMINFKKTKAITESQTFFAFHLGMLAKTKPYSSE